MISFQIKRGEPVNVLISFKLKPSAKRVMGLVASVTPRGSDMIVTRNSKDIVQMLLHLETVIILQLFLLIYNVQ